MAYAFKKGELAQNEVSPDVIQLANSMTMKQLKDFAATKHEGLPDKVTEAEDHEVGMAIGQLEAIMKSAEELMQKLGTEEKNIPGWIQSHITSAYEYLKQANDNFHELEENIALGNLGGMGANFLPTGTEVGSGDILSGTGSAEEEYKKKKKKRERIMKTKTFEQFVNEINNVVNEANEPSSALKQFAEDEKSEGNGGEIYLAEFDGSSFKAQSTNKTWDDGVPVTKYFTRGGYKSTSPKGQIWIIESENWWYFQNKGTWFAVSRKEYDRPPFDY